MKLPKNKILIDSSRYDTSENTWKTIKPTSWEMYDGFINRLTVAPDYKTGFVSIAFDHFSPTFAASLLDKYIASINLFMTNRKLEQAEQNLKYLNLQLNETTNLEMKNVFFCQMNKQMVGGKEVIYGIVLKEISIAQ